MYRAISACIWSRNLGVDNCISTFIYYLYASSPRCPMCLSLKSHLGNVLVDMKLIDIKDTLPVGFIPIQETVDTRKS